MPEKKLILLGVALVLGFVSQLKAEEIAPPQDATSCIEEIKDVCVGLESSLESCLARRAERMSTPCAQLLRSAVTMAQNKTGPGACVSDVKQACPGLEGSALTQCVVDKKSGFSHACREYLESGPSGSSDLK